MVSPQVAVVTLNRTSHTIGLTSPLLFSQKNVIPKRLVVRETAAGRWVSISNYRQPSLCLRTFLPNQASWFICPSFQTDIENGRPTIRRHGVHVSHLEKYGRSWRPYDWLVTSRLWGTNVGSGRGGVLGNWPRPTYLILWFPGAEHWCSTSVSTVSEGIAFVEIASSFTGDH